MIQADGGLNAGTAPQFMGDLEKLVDAGLRKIIVDCTKLNYISSYGLGVLMTVHKQMAKHGGDVKICCVKSVVHDVLRLVKLDQFFQSYADLNRARLAFRQPES